MAGTAQGSSDTATWHSKGATGSDRLLPGTGQIAFAIDAELLYSRFGRDEELPQQLLETELASARGHIVDLKPARLKPRVEPLINLLNVFYRRMVDKLGESLEKQMLLESFGQLQQEVEEAELAG